MCWKINNLSKHCQLRNNEKFRRYFPFSGKDGACCSGSHTGSPGCGHMYLLSSPTALAQVTTAEGLSATLAGGTSGPGRAA